MVRPALDALPAPDIVAILLDAEARVLPAVRAVAPAIAAAADLLAESWRAGGRLVFAGAGTSGRLASTQAAELPGTFGVPRERIVTLVAGGVGATDDDEDDVVAAAADLAAIRLHARDAVVAVAASGSTPSTVTVARTAIDVGAKLVSLTTVPGAPLAALAHVAIEPDVGREPLRGSSRLGAGTAQKIALDALTTTLFSRLGRVHDDLMIDVVPANAKLRERSAGIVAEIAGCPLEEARAALTACAGDARAAVLVLTRAVDPAEGRVRAAEHATLRGALTS